MCAFNAGGKQSLQVHAVTKKHKYNADGRKGRVQGQVSVVAPLAGDTDEEYNNMNSEVTEEEQERPGQAIAEEREGRSGGTGMPSMFCKLFAYTYARKNILKLSKMAPKMPKTGTKSFK